jgi:hypothetical protein
MSLEEEKKQQESLVVLCFLISSAIFTVVDEKGNQSYKELENLTRQIRR